MALRSIICNGRIDNNGGVEILSKGFCYSKTVTWPTLADSVWSITTDNGLGFTSTITGLEESTKYYVNAYATNSYGTAYSDASIPVKTGGITVFPTISINVTNNGISKTVYEMGTTNPLVVSGDLTANEETVFIDGGLNQTSYPTVLNPIKSWTGQIINYTTATPPININFTPRALDSATWIMNHDVYYNCGTIPNNYSINNTITTNGVFPYLWILKSGTQTAQYFSPISPGNNYFFYESSMPPTSKPTNGKVIKNKETIESFLVTPYDLSHQYLILGYPSYYGTIRYKLPGGSWTTPNNLNSYNVSTGIYIGITTPYTYLFNILQYQFQSLSQVPLEFQIQFQ